MAAKKASSSDAVKSGSGMDGDSRETEILRRMLNTPPKPYKPPSKKPATRAKKGEKK